MTRSEVMSRIRSTGTGLEEAFRLLASRSGVKVRTAYNLYGKPDFRVIGTKTLIFVNSCFWHGCPVHCRMPANRRRYWQPKIAGNVRRQACVLRKLRRMGYSVFVVWEHDFRYAGLRGKLQRLKPR